MKNMPDNLFLSRYTPFEYLVGLLAATIPLFSVNFSAGMYYCSILLFILGLVEGFKNQRRFETTEKFLIVAWLMFPILVLLDLLFRVGFSWASFQEASRFLIGIPVFLLLRKYRFPLEFIVVGVFIGAIWAGSFGLYQKFYLAWLRAYGGTSGGEISFGNISLLLGFLGFALAYKLEFLGRTKILFGLLILAFGVAGSVVSGTKGGWMSAPLLFWLLLVAL